jgi:hypothetical protein
MKVRLESFPAISMITVCASHFQEEKASLKGSCIPFHIFSTFLVKKENCVFMFSPCHS